MKALELTQEHKDKLLEMCNMLFPEYKYWDLHDGTCDLCTENTLDYSLEEKPQWNSWNRIHWFEFCVKILGQKLLDIDDDADDYYDFIGECCAATSHPIDYLYEEFKKLKL